MDITDAPVPENGGVDTPPAIGVVVATRGRPELLMRAVRSVWGQTYEGPLHLVVVVDDADQVLPSPAPPAAHHRVSVVRNEGRPGLAGARNYGLTLVREPLLATLDDDDDWMPRRLEQQVAMLASDATLVGAGGHICVVQPGSRTTRTSPLSRIRHSDLIHDRIAALHPSTFLLRSEVVRHISGWDADIPGGYAEDYDFLLRMTLQGDIGMVDDVVADVHWAGHSYFFSRWAQIADALNYLLLKHPDFATSGVGRGRVLGQVAFARAASRDKRTAWRAIGSSLRASPREPRTYLAALVAAGVISPDRVQQLLHTRGRGI